MIRRALAAAAMALAMGPALANFDDGSFDQGSFDTNSFEMVDLVQIPDCSGLDEAACTTAVEGEGFVASPVSTCSATVASGDVIRTSPPGLTSAPAGSTVIIRVSNGMECESSRGRRIGIGLGISIN